MPKWPLYAGMIALAAAGLACLAQAVFGDRALIFWCTAVAYVSLALVWGTARVGRWLVTRYSISRRVDGPETDYHDPAP
jgi:hypothetical protein